MIVRTQILRKHYKCDSSGSNGKGTVRVENTTINLAANAQSGVLIDGELTDVSLVNTKIEGQVNGSNQFGVYIHHKKRQ